LGLQNADNIYNGSSPTASGKIGLASHQDGPENFFKKAKKDPDRG